MATTDPLRARGDIVDSFYQAMCEAQLQPSDPSVLTADGKLHRYHPVGDKAGSQNGWFVLFSSGVPAGVFGTWKNPDNPHSWRLKVGRELTAGEVAESRRQAEAARAARAADLEAERAVGREKAQRLWNEAGAHVTVTHPYLEKKKVRPLGIRQLGQQLLIPVRDASEELHGLQFIQPDGSKKFSRGTAKSGHYHAIGQPLHGEVLAICEGYATAATVHEVTGWPVAVAFDAGNLTPVGKALRAKLPDARLVFCADNDAGTDGNPGLTRARAAAHAVDGMVVAPEFDCDEAGTDWNDFAATRGPEAARDALFNGAATALSSHDEELPHGTMPAQAVPAHAPAGATVLTFPGKRSKASADQSGRAVGFTVDDEGVWFRGGKAKGSDEPPMRVSPPLHVVAYLRDNEQDNWGLLLQWKDRDGHPHTWAMPESMFKGSGEEMRGELLRQGFRVPMSSDRRGLFMAYLDQAKPKQCARSIERTGWFGAGQSRVFVFPERTIGHQAEPVHFQSESMRDRIYRQSGTLEEWRANLADLCRGNTRLAFAVSTAFASMLLEQAGEESGGFHFRGDGSTGKTTILRVAASVFGGADYPRRWRATDNGIEAIAVVHNDALLILDELAQIDPKVAGAIAYMLGNGEGKQRAYRSGAPRAVQKWRLLYLSAGEISLGEHLRQEGQRVRAGQETRLVEIPAEVRSGTVFDTNHGYADGGAFARALTSAANLYHGTPALAFIDAMLGTGESLTGEIVAFRARFCTSVLPPMADGQAMRVAMRFALVAFAGEFATRVGITCWEPGEAENAARACFKAWLGLRGGAKNMEPAQIIAQIRYFLERYGESRFTAWKADRFHVGSNDRVINERAGFRKPTVMSGTTEPSWTYYIFKEVFRKEICAGFNDRAVAKALFNAGMLERDEASRKWTRNERLPELGHQQCYVIKPSIWQFDGSDETGARDEPCE